MDLFNFKCRTCNMTKEVGRYLKEEIADVYGFLQCACGGKMFLLGVGDIEDPKEINFVTHPFLDTLVEEIEKDPNMAYTITHDGKPIVVVISPEAFERTNKALESAKEI